MFDNGVILFSPDTLEEFNTVLFRPKFDSHMSKAKRHAFLYQLWVRATVIQTKEMPEACRDPKDKKLLAVALGGEADVLVSGDKDLLALHPFRGIKILSPRHFLEALGR